MRCPVGLFFDIEGGWCLQLLKDRKAGVLIAVDPRKEPFFMKNRVEISPLANLVVSQAGDSSHNESLARALFVTLEHIVSLAFWAAGTSDSGFQMRQASTDIGVRKQIELLCERGTISKKAKEFLVGVFEARNVYFHTVTRLADIELFETTLEECVLEEFRALELKFSNQFEELWCLFVKHQAKQIDWDTFSILLGD